jgi:hypothetical protein
MRRPISGSNINQTSLGFVDPTNYANRGCMSQLGSRYLANSGDSFDTILKFYYGDDIQIVQSSGTCITSTFDDGGTIVQPDGGIVGSKGGSGGTAPSKNASKSMYVTLLYFRGGARIGDLRAAYFFAPLSTSTSSRTTRSRSFFFGDAIASFTQCSMWRSSSIFSTLLSAA